MQILDLEKLYKIMIKKNLSENDLAELITKSDNKLFNLLHDTDFDPFEYLKVLKIANALKIDISEIIVS